MSINAAIECWNYGTVSAAIDHEHRVMRVEVIDRLPGEPGDFDPIELDWQAFIGDFRRRFGDPGDIGEPTFDRVTGTWTYEIDLKGVSTSANA